MLSSPPTTKEQVRNWWGHWTQVTEELSGVIYKVSCGCGATYIRETGHTLCLRLQEHRQAVRNCDMNNGIAAHVARTHHEIQGEASVVTTKSHLTKKKGKEALIIRSAPNNMNPDKDFQLDNTWCPPPQWQPSPLLIWFDIMGSLFLCLAYVNLFLAHALHT